MVGSKYNRLLTLEYLQTENENKYYDRKSGKIKPSDLSKHISAFANADGGTIAVGLDDSKTIEGINQFGEKRLTILLMHQETIANQCPDMSTS